MIYITHVLLIIPPSQLHPKGLVVSTLCKDTPCVLGKSTLFCSSLLWMLSYFVLYVCNVCNDVLTEAVLGYYFQLAPGHPLIALGSLISGCSWVTQWILGESHLKRVNWSISEYDLNIMVVFSALLHSLTVVCIGLYSSKCIFVSLGATATANPCNIKSTSMSLYPRLPLISLKHNLVSSPNIYVKCYTISWA